MSKPGVKGHDGQLIVVMGSGPVCVPWVLAFPFVHVEEFRSHCPSLICDKRCYERASTAPRPGLESQNFIPLQMNAPSINALTVDH